MRFIIFLIIFGTYVRAQVPAPAPLEPAAPPAQLDVPPLRPPIQVDVPPFRPPDLASPYASPRDAARHRLQATLADLQSKRDPHAAVRGFGDALAIDPTYAIAAFDLAVVAAVAERWEDALAAFEEAARLDPTGLGPEAKPQFERLRLIADLEKTSDGKRRRLYQEALLPLLVKLPSMPEAEAMAAVAEVGRLDPKRWEAPALLAGLNGNGHGYDVASKFLEIAATNTTDPAIQSALQKALKASEREMRFAAARAAAELAADAGDHAKAAELFETAWTAIPSRADNGLSAASELLLQDDTAKASALLSRLLACGDAQLAESAGAMLKQLEPIEPAAKAASADSGQFFRDPGARDPVRIATLIPPIDRTEMEVLARPLPKLVKDSEPVVTLASLSADPADAAQATALPPLPDPSISFENAWRDIQTAHRPHAASIDALPPSRAVEIVELAKGSKTARLLKLSTEPAGARVLLDDRVDAVCQTPCNIQTEAGQHHVRLSLAGYKDEERDLSVTGRTPLEVSAPLLLVRGSVLVETPVPGALKVNGTPLNVSAPAELALMPGLHLIAVEFGSTVREQMLMVKPGARLRISLKP